MLVSRPAVVRFVSGTGTVRALIGVCGMTGPGGGVASGSDRSAEWR
ncbi:hypothetical protein JOF36_005017 [Pseudonocardia parietis]|uniref:Uncharacterized protein n=1 Tax=Pseudonocardia parietis TaxID=570936 RepID=A0ABS4VZI0_9PSEU|nr:hypothetical protein [Pseudonocardia parietis]